MNIATDHFRLVIGLGETGWSVVRYLAKHQLPFAVADTREQPPYGTEFQQQLPTVPSSLGFIDEQLIRRANEIVLSPGIAHDNEFVNRAKEWGKSIISDITLFRRAVSCPVIAITGTNGKSTVTSLLSAMAQKQGIKAASGGNLGVPALDLIDDEIEAYILELSSFQLEITHQLAATIACLTNVTPDHTERYATFEAYYRAKQKIFEQCSAAIYSKFDKLSLPLFVPQEGGATAVSLGPPDKGEWGILVRHGESYIARGVDLLMPLKDIKLLGRHNVTNILLALAIAAKMDWSVDLCLEVAKTFRGLPHRCEWVAKVKGVDYVNDSKATNPAAVVAALNGLAENYQHIHIILGGSSKQADFSPVSKALGRWPTTAYLMGEEAERLKKALAAETLADIYSDLAAAFNHCCINAKKGDLILLAPGCASFDNYENFAARGDHFKSLVKEYQIAQK